MNEENELVRKNQNLINSRKITPELDFVSNLRGFSALEKLENQMKKHWFFPQNNGKKAQYYAGDKNRGNGYPLLC